MSASLVLFTAGISRRALAKTEAHLGYTGASIGPRSGLWKWMGWKGALVQNCSFVNQFLVRRRSQPVPAELQRLPLPSVPTSGPKDASLPSSPGEKPCQGTLELALDQCRAPSLRPLVRDGSLTQCPAESGSDLTTLLHDSRASPLRQLPRASGWLPPWEEGGRGKALVVPEKQASAPTTICLLT